MKQPNQEKEPVARKFWGLLSRKERWGLSWKGRLAAVVSILITGLILFFRIYPFLAVTHRVDSKILVVEGWVHPFTMEAAAKEFKEGRYEQAFTTGGPEEGTGLYPSDYQTSAHVGADLLQASGVPEQFIQMVPSHVWKRNRTYYSAVALRDWFRDHNMHVQSINVVTEAAHARRTWLLFREAFGKDVQVGIISAPSPDYDANQWWKYSEGVREVIDETAAYIYARVFVLLNEFHNN